MFVNSMHHPEHGLYYSFLLPYGLYIFYTCFVSPKCFSDNSSIPASHVVCFASENEINGYGTQLRTRGPKNLIHFAAVVSSHSHLSGSNTKEEQLNAACQCLESQRHSLK